MITRRRFLAGILPLAAVACGGLTYLGYRWGACPLSSQEFCEGPCAAYFPGDDGLCLRLPRVAAADKSFSPTTAAGLATATPMVAPTATGPASASTSAPLTPTPVLSATLQPSATPQPAVKTRCPFGLQNDPYPGRCRRYVDKNGNGYCDLSEPETTP